MTAAVVAPERWELQGEHVADRLDAVSAVAVVGEDAHVAAQVAVGIARALARRRRVALADAVGEEPAIQELVPGDQPYGLVDSFLYGVSLSKVAHPIDPARNLYVLPSGAGPIDQAALLESGRWGRLASGFREAGAMLIVVASAHAPSLPALLAVLDGVVNVGTVSLPDDTRRLATVVSESGDRRPAGAVSEVWPTSLAWLRNRVQASKAVRSERPIRPRHWGWTALVALVLAGLAAAVVSLHRRSHRTPGEPSTDADRGTATVTVGTASPGERSGRSIANPRDSASAAAYVVALASYDRPEDANATVRSARDRHGLAAATVSEVVVGGKRWYRVTVGAFCARPAADSLLALLRFMAVVASEGGRVVEAPLSVRVGDRSVRPTDAVPLVAALRAKGYAAFLMAQAGGMVSVYIGAFERVDEAVPLLAALRADTVRGVVAYRVGSVS